jgi:uncharacterized protein (TIGR00369 family)
VVMSLTPQECQYNMLGTVHGGVMATLLDSVMGCAVHSTLPARSGYSTVEIKVNYVRPITLEVNSLGAEGRVLHARRRIVTAEGAVRDSTNSMPMARRPVSCSILTRADVGLRPRLAVLSDNSDGA